MEYGLKHTIVQGCQVCVTKPAQKDPKTSPMALCKYQNSTYAITIHNINVLPSLMHYTQFQAIIHTQSVFIKELNGHNLAQFYNW